MKNCISKVKISGEQTCMCKWVAMLYSRKKKQCIGEIKKLKLKNKKQKSRLGK